jgi:hypothetical protein
MLDPSGGATFQRQLVAAPGCQQSFGLTTLSTGGAASRRQAGLSGLVAQQACDVFAHEPLCVSNAPPRSPTTVPSAPETFLEKRVSLQ